MVNNDRAKLARRTVLGATGLGVLGALAGGSTLAEEQDDDGGGHDVQDVIKEWDEKPRQIAETTMEKYDKPDEVVPSRLIWHHGDDAPWNRTELFRDAVPHNFPKPHPDHLEQFIDLHIPPAEYDCVARFDGSVMLERTKGEVSARCDIEEANFLAINLTHELVTTDMTVEEARRAYGEAMISFMETEEPTERMQGFQFDLPAGDQRDPDVAIIEDGEIVMREAIGPENDEER